MYEEGYQNITNTDISQICVKTMDEKNKIKYPQMACILINPHIYF